MSEVGREGALRLSPSRSLAVAAALVGAVLVAFVVATQPGIRKNEVTEASLWALLVLVSFAGWGSALAWLVSPTRRLDPGLRAVWGGGVLVAVAGVLAAASLFSRTTALLLVDAGLIAAGVDVVRSRDALLRWGHRTWRAARAQPIVHAMAFGAVALTALHFLAATGDGMTNPYDDDIAYFPLVKKLLQTGTMIEPFSFRRLSALGGQIFFLALLLPHATFQNMHVFDRGICLAGLVLLVIGFRSGGKRAPLWLTTLAIVVLLSMPNTAINTGSHWSGAFFFFGLFRTLHWANEAHVREAPAWKRTLPVALVAIASCTLRQNFLAPAAVMVVASQGFAAFGGPAEGRSLLARAKAGLPETLIVGGLSAAVLVPWLVLSMRSNATPLFPVILGTYNKAMVLTNGLFGWLDEVRFTLGVAIDNEPIRTLPVLVVAALLVPDRSRYRPLLSLWLGAASGFFVLAHSFSQSDAGNLGRYLFGFLAALALASMLSAGAAWSTVRPSRAARTAAILAFIGVAGQLYYAKDRLSRRYDAIVTSAKLHLRDAPVAPETARPENYLYADLQGAIPPGERFAVLVDEPYYLDFARNPIWNLDMPGYASLPPGMPYFLGSEPKAEYLKKIGVRYLMFVRAKFSRVHYRREFWFHRMFTDEEVWRIASPYEVDMVDSLAELRQSKKIVKELRGIVVLDLQTAAPADQLANEVAR